MTYKYYNYLIKAQKYGWKEIIKDRRDSPTTREHNPPHSKKERHVCPHAHTNVNTRATLMHSL